MIFCFDSSIYLSTLITIEKMINIYEYDITSWSSITLCKHDEANQTLSPLLQDQAVEELARAHTRTRYTQLWHTVLLSY